MIIFNKLWETMREKGVSTYTLREKCGIDSKTVRRLKVVGEAFRLPFVPLNHIETKRTVQRPVPTNNLYCFANNS